MAHYNYIHHRIRRKRAKIDRKRVRIQRRDEKSCDQRLRRRQNDDRLASVTKAKEGRLIPTSWRLRKGNINA
jgi:hypothetical protein